MIRGKNTLKILRFIAGYTGLLLGDLAMAFLDPYSKGLLADGYRINNEENSLREVFNHIHPSSQKRHSFAQLMYRLKRDGLIHETNNKFKLTGLGHTKLKRLENSRAATLPDQQYESTFDNELKIVMFDIPESQAHKRLWLRSVLKNLGYTMLQKSVWVGKTKIPKLFINNLKGLHILKHIEILAVTKKGSLREIT